jgi:hypothetical protein
MSVSNSPDDVQARRSARRPPERGRGGGGNTALWVLVVAAGLGAVAAWPSVGARLTSIFGHSPSRANTDGTRLPVGAATVDDRLEALEAALAPLPLRMDLMEQRLAQIELQPSGGRGGGDGAANPQVGQLAAEMDKLRHEVDAIRSAGSDVAIAGRLSSAMEKTEAAVRRLAGRRDHTALAVLAIGQLREAVDRGGAFDAQLATAVQVAGGRTKAALGGLSPYARGGVPTRTAILGQFAAASRAASRAVIDDSDSWWEGRLLMALNSVVTVRRAEGGDRSAVIVLSQAGRLVDAGDLSGALAVLRLLPGPSADVFAPWIASGAARLAADGAVSDAASAAIAETVTADE